MPTSYHIQYGQMRQIGRFVAEIGGLERGQAVVVESSRGVEMGRVIGEAASGEAGRARQRVVRIAEVADFDRARTVEAERDRRFEDCRRVFDDGVWPIEPIDVEPMLDEGRAVLYYLGPHQLDVSGLRAAFLDACGLDLVFEPVGRDAPAEEVDDHEADDHGCGDCGSGGCGTGGGCGTKAEGSGGGCSGCAVSELVSTRRKTASAV